MDKLKKQAPLKKGNGQILLGRDTEWIARYQELKKQEKLQEERKRQEKENGKILIGHDTDWIQRYLAIKEAERKKQEEEDSTPQTNSDLPWAVRPVKLEETDLTNSKVIVISTKSEENV